MVGPCSPIRVILNTFIYTAFHRLNRYNNDKMQQIVNCLVHVRYGRRSRPKGGDRLSV